MFTPILNATLGKFLHLDSINIGLSGVLDLYNVALNVETIQHYVPAKIKLGNVKHVHIECSFLSPFSSPVKCVLNDVSVVASLPGDSSEDLEVLDPILLQTKIAALFAWEVFRFKDHPYCTSGEDKTMFMSALDAMVNNTTIEVNRVHIILDEVGINAGIVVKKVNVQPIDDQGNILPTCPTDGTMARRKAIVDGFGVYFNIDTDIAIDANSQKQQQQKQQVDQQKQHHHNKDNTNKEVLSKQQQQQQQEYNLIRTISPLTLEHCQSIWGKDKDNVMDEMLKNPKLHWLIPPSNTYAEAVINMSKNTPQYFMGWVPAQERPIIEATAHVKQIQLYVDKEKHEGLLLCIHELLGNSAAMLLLQSYIQPHIEALKSAKCQYNNNNNNTNNTISNIPLLTNTQQQLNDALRYIKLYKSNFQGYTVRNDDEDKEMKLLEEKYPIQQLFDWRQLAIEIIKIECTNQKNPPIWGPKPSGGWFGGWFGSSDITICPPNPISSEKVKQIIQNPSLLLQYTTKKTTATIDKSNNDTITTNTTANQQLSTDNIAFPHIGDDLIMESEFVRMKANIKVDKALVHVTRVDDDTDNDGDIENKKEKQQQPSAVDTCNNNKQIVTLDVDTIQAIFNLWNNNTWYETRIDSLNVIAPTTSNNQEEQKKEEQKQEEQGNNNNDTNNNNKPTTFNIAFQLGGEFISPQINYLNQINLKVMNLMNFINLLKAAQLESTILPGLEKFVFPSNFKQIIDNHISLHLSEQNTNNNNVQHQQQNKDENNSNNIKEQNQSYVPQTKCEHHAKHTIKSISFNTPSSTSSPSDTTKIQNVDTK